MCFSTSKPTDRSRSPQHAVPPSGVSPRNARVASDRNIADELKSVLKAPTLRKRIGFSSEYGPEKPGSVHFDPAKKSGVSNSTPPKPRIKVRTAPRIANMSVDAGVEEVLAQARAARLKFENRLTSSDTTTVTDPTLTSAPDLPLHAAANALSRPSKKIRQALASGADINSLDLKKRSALHIACLNGRMEAARCLIQQGADPNLADFRNATPLHYACEAGLVSIVKLLLEKGAAVDRTDEDNGTPLYYATCDISGTLKPELIRILLEHDADTELDSGLGFTLLHQVSMKGSAECTELLFSAEAMNVRDKMWKQTPLAKAARRGHLAVVMFLVERGADLTLRDKNGKTALSLATKHGHVEVVTFLKEFIACKAQLIARRRVKIECAASV